MTLNDNTLSPQSLVMGIDPSSTAIGFGVLRAGDLSLVDAGVLRPNTKSAHYENRVFEMASELIDLLDVLIPEIVVVETTVGKVGRRHKGGGAGLSVYGYGVGYVKAVVDAWCGTKEKTKSYCVRENMWTEGETKENRSRNISLLYPQLDLSKDTGLDAADGVGIARWFCERKDISHA